MVSTLILMLFTHPWWPFYGYLGDRWEWTGSIIQITLLKSSRRPTKATLISSIFFCLTIILWDSLCVLVSWHLFWSDSSGIHVICVSFSDRTVILTLLSKQQWCLVAQPWITMNYYLVHIWFSRCVNRLNWNVEGIRNLKRAYRDDGHRLFKMTLYI